MISVQNLNLSFPDNVVFKDLNLNFDNGISCIMGENGKGKTCLLHILMGIKDYDSGQIISDYHKPALLFQEDRLLPWLNVLDNVKLVANKERALYYLDKVGLSDRVNYFPKELSGGMNRRLAIARALAYEGDLLLLDEPFKGLDDVNKNRVIELLKRENKPIIMVTHSLDEVKALNGRLINI